MRPRSHVTAAVLATAIAAALPAGAGAKGIPAAARVCGADGCHRVDQRAVREGFERFTDAPTPDAAEPFFTVRARARVSSGRLADVFAFDWLPRAGVARPSGARLWTRPDPVLAAALRRAAHGLTPKPAAEFGSVHAAPQARVVEVYAPATAERSATTTTSRNAGLAVLLLAGAAALAIRRRPTAHP
jgi:hypothetical protein